MSRPTAARAPERIAIRDANDADLPFIQAIYAHHVQTGLGSFEEIAPTLEEMRRLRKHRQIPPRCTGTRGTT